MSDYYLDIETYAKESKPNFAKDEIITITYQQMDSRSGQVKGPLNILKSWESSEEDILQKFHIIFNPFDKSRCWEFIPIGFNLKFDFATLLYRWRKIGVEVNPITLFAQQPAIDINAIVIMFNGGEFKGAKLENYSEKKQNGSVIAELYENKDYQAIEKYITEETGGFLGLYQLIARTFPNFWQEMKAEG